MKNSKIGGFLDNWVHSKYQPQCFIPQTTHRVAMATFWLTVHSVMMVKSALAGEGARPPPFTLSPITSKVVVS
jgi:hypothetical protein